MIANIEARKEADRITREGVICGLVAMIRWVNQNPRLEALPGELWDEAMRREQNIRAGEARSALEEGNRGA